MSDKHTPGPWAVRETATHVTVVGANGEALFHDDKRIPLFLDDAHLIAAAPELLIALKDVLSEFAKDGHGGEFEDGEHPYVDAARAAIAKATGGAA